MTVNALYPTVAPSLDLNFVRSGVLDSRVTFTRSSTATYFNSFVSLVTAPTNVPRLDFNPSTLAAQGLLIEESRVNSIRNSAMIGAVAGTPGNLPINWVALGAGLGTLTQQIVGTGTSAGITYIDVKISGTTSTTSFGIQFESYTQIAAATGQNWTSSIYVALIAGATTNLTVNHRVQERTALGVSLANTTVDITASLTSSLLNRFTNPRVFNQATTAFSTNDITLFFSSGVAIDITLRIGLPQLEQGAFATSVIPTTTAAVTRSADVASVNTLTPWFNATEGTLYAESFLTRQSATAGTNVFYIWNTSTSEIKLYYRGSGTTGATVVDATVNQADLTPTGVLTANTVAKLSLAYKANDFAASGNGGAAVTDATGTVPAGMSQVLLGGPNGVLNGYIRRITYYPRRLSNAELQTITA